MIEVIPRPKKRTFLMLILASLCLTIVSTYGLWHLSVPGLKNISTYLPLILGIILATILLATTLGVTGIILAIIGLPTLNVFRGLAWSTIHLLFPLVIRLGKLVDIDKERIECSFIETSNHLVRNKNIKVPPNKLLILTPHCIQNESCQYKITKNVNNCRMCGRCQVKDLLLLANNYNVHLAIVTGGTLARKIIKTLKPAAVLAIACERDLTSGIQDVYPLPVIGVLNERPFGPCCNTQVNIDRVKLAIEDFIICDK